MATQAEKFSEIADAIRIKTGKDSPIVANDFAKEIKSIDRLQRMFLYETEFSNGFYGIRAARIAATYQQARVIGTENFVEDFVYSQDSIFNRNSTLRDEKGRACIDCSTLVGLVLRGISYDKSPYGIYRDASATWSPPTELPEMYGKDGWEYTVLDKQPDGAFKDIGIDGCTTIRTAADLGEFFYKNGLVLFDSKIDGDSTSDIINLVEAGDLLFWSKDNASEAVKNRYRSISHVAIVAENHKRFFEATTGESVVLYSSLAEKYDQISLIIRPDYRPRKPKENIPIGLNLLTYPWSWGGVKTSTSEGITCETIGINTIHISGASTDENNTFRNLKGSNNTSDFITLTNGIYQVSGMTTGITDTSVNLQILKSNGEEFEEKIICYDGNNPTFAITEETNVIVRLYFKYNCSVDCDITPSLIRIQ